MSTLGRQGSFLAELQRRHVYKVGAMYGVGGWLLVQVVTQVLPVFHVADSVQRWIVISVIAGFPVALVLAWLFDLTPQGIVRTQDVPASGETPVEQTQRRTMDRKLNYVLGALVALGITYVAAERAGWIGVATPNNTAAGPDSKSIAVLPFIDLSPQHDQEYFSDGMAEELLNALARVDALKVAGRTSSFSFKGKNEDLREIGKALGVANVLEGSVRKQGEKVRITAQLIRTADGYHLWSEAYDGELTDIFDLQERIAQAITRQLRVVLDGGPKQRLVPVATGNPDAYGLYLKASAVFNRRDGAHFDEAIADLQEAIRLDPGFARAQARLASLYSIAANWTAKPLAETAPATERAAQAAITLDAGLAEPHAALGEIYAALRRPMDARREFLTALALDPNDSTTNVWYGEELYNEGYVQQGTEYLDKALSIDRLMPLALFLRGSAYYAAGDPANARIALEKSLAQGMGLSERNLALIDQSEGRSAEAIAAFSRGMKQLLYGSAGLPDDAGQRIAEGVFGDEAARQGAVAMLQAYLARKPPVVAGSVPWALLLLHEPALALSAGGAAPTTNDGPFFFAIWWPVRAPARARPEFPDFARRVGWAQVWDQYGPPPGCRRLAASDYACD